MMQLNIFPGQFHVALVMFSTLNHETERGGVDYPLQIFIRRCLPRLSPPPLATSPMSILFRYFLGEIQLKRMTEYPPFFSVVTTLVGRGVVIPVELLLSVVKFTSAMKKGIAQEVNNSVIIPLLIVMHILAVI